jgi:hypothetical protein
MEANLNNVGLPPHAHLVSNENQSTENNIPRRPHTRDKTIIGSATFGRAIVEPANNTVNARSNAFAYPCHRLCSLFSLC